MLRTLQRKCRTAARQIQTLGLGPMLWYRWKGRTEIRKKPVRTTREADSARRFRLWAKELEHPVWCREDGSDFFVFRDIFMAREYRCLDQEHIEGLILDLGANAGYSSAWMLSRFPNAQVIAVEPDAGNARLARENLLPWGSRAQVLETAVWSHATGLMLDETSYGDGLEWARTVREARSEETPLMMATDIPTLLKESGQERIALLKVDIEGAESVIFSAQSTPWLSQVDRIVIELHGSECERVFHQAIAGQNFHVSRCDELTVCLR